MADIIDDLKVQIDASTNSADAKIDKFISKMRSLQSALSGVEMSGASQVASGLNQISSAIMNFSQNTKTADFSRVTRGLNKLAAVDVQGVGNAARAMSTLSANLSSMGNIQYDASGIIGLANAISNLGRKTVTQAATNIPLLRSSLQGFIQTMNGLQSVSFDPSGLVSLTSSITRLGGKSAGNAIPNIQVLGVSLRQLMTTLAGVPTVSNNLIRMTNALANLASNGSRVGSASRAMQNSLNNYSYTARKATKSTKGLVSQFGMFYARCFLLIRGLKALWRAIKSSMDYIETLNYFDAAWGQVAANATGEWAKAGYDSATEYANSFSNRAKELTGKMSGFLPDVNGNLASTGMPSLGLDPNMLMNYQATFGQMASSMGVASETALKLSNALTMIGADLASVKNLKFKDVWNDMASGMVGMSRTLDKYGVNIRNVNLQQKLNELGVNANIAALNQQDKALLRGIILLQSTKYAWGDMARTLGQPANQLRLLQSNFANLARAIGNLFLPIVAKVLPYINALVIALQRLFSWIGGLLGIKIGSFGMSIGSAATDMGGIADDAEDTADSMGGAADNAKKMAANLQGFDKLNVVTSSDSGSGGGGSGGGGAGGGGLLDDAFLDAFAEYQAAWDAAFANMENSAQELADRICNAFKRGDYKGIGEYIGNAISDGLESIKWAEVYAVADGFGTGLAEFLNGLISPRLFDNIGKTVAGYLNTVLHFLDSFGTTFEWTEFGNSIAAGINGFFGKYDFALLANTINVWGHGILDTAITTLDRTNWTLIGTQIGTFLEKIDFTGIGSKVGVAIWKAINSGVEVWKSSFKAAPIETSVITAIGLLKFTGLGKLVSAKILSSLAKGLSFAGIGKLLAKAFPSSVIISTITTTMAGTGASLPAVLSGLLLTPIKTFFTVTVPGMITSSLASIGTMVTGGLTALAGTLGVSVTAAGAIVIAAVAAAVAGVVYTVTHWDEIKEFWSVKVPAWWSGTVIPFFEGIPQKLADIWENVKLYASEKWDAFIEYMSSIPEKISGVINDIGDWFGELPGKIGYALGYALGTVTKWGTDLFNYLAEKIPEIITNVVTWFSELPGKIHTAISTVLSNIATWGAKVFEAFKVKVSEIITNVVTWFSELPSKIYDAIIKIKDKISTWAVDAIGFFKTEVPKIVDKVIEFFGELPKKIVTVGENIVKGLWEGINNMVDWLGTGIVDFCRGVIDGFKAGFDEHSPSKEAFQIGDFFTMGLKNGIFDKFKDIYSMIDTFSRNLTDYQLAVPVQSDYVINREVFDMIDTQSRVSLNYSGSDFKSDVSAEIRGAFSNMLDYDKLGESVYRAHSRAMQENPVKIGDEDVFNSSRRGQKHFYDRNRKTGIYGVD